ncbi:MAG: hypothetical protein LBV13_05485 [Methanomassiliicoccaceae archaeon]|nr:hypothetical protein [Methanomassiliicoccaceae archaeon]
MAVTYKNSSPNVPGSASSQKKQKVKRKESSKKQSMLNTNRMAPFKYDLNEILSSTSMDASAASSFLASIVAKASRVSTKEAKEFAKTFVESGSLTKEEYDRICRLMDRYSKFR